MKPAENEYSAATAKSRLAAVEALAEMRLPVESPAKIEAESTPSVEPLP